MSTEEFAIGDIAAKLTEDEYEWFATTQYIIGVGVGRRQMKETITAFLKQYSGELYSNSNDDDADFVRTLRSTIIEKIEI